MREIKFRGKTGTVKGNKWIYGYLYKASSFFDTDYRYYIRNEHLVDAMVDENTIGQYTGLRDKNGTEIYEGDIVKINSEYFKFIGEIIWDSYDCAFIFKNNEYDIEEYLLYQKEEIEVIRKHI